MPDGKNEAKNSTMNLTIDMGNTRVKYAVFDGGTVVSDGCSEEFDEAVIDRILAAHPGITQAIVATTRGPVDDTVALVRRRIGRCLRLSPQLPLPIRNGYTTPETLGEDRRRCVALPGPQFVDRGFRDGHYHRSGFCRRGFPGR